jgi:hypothetical protein
MPAPVACVIRIQTVLDHSGEADSYTPGGLFTVRGSGFGDYRHVPRGTGIYLAAQSGGRLVQVFRYLKWSDSEIAGVWPVGVHGLQWLFIGREVATGIAMSAPHRLAPSQ